MTKLYLCFLLVGSIFVDNLAAAPTEVSDQVLPDGRCPNNRPEIDCEVNPCDVTPYGYCPLHRTAVCKPYKCGMCAARWYNEANERVYCYAF